MTKHDHTRTERSQRFRQKMKDEGRKEVRGIWATPDEEKVIKEFAKELINTS